MKTYAAEWRTKFIAFQLIFSKVVLITFWYKLDDQWKSSNGEQTRPNAVWTGLNRFERHLNFQNQWLGQSH